MCIYRFGWISAMIGPRALKNGQLGSIKASLQGTKEVHFPHLNKKSHRF